jgi:hypothetical protein
VLRYVKSHTRSGGQRRGEKLAEKARTDKKQDGLMAMAKRKWQHPPSVKLSLSLSHFFFFEWSESCECAFFPFTFQETRHLKRIFVFKQNFELFNQKK